MRVRADLGARVALGDPLEGSGDTRREERLTTLLGCASHRGRLPTELGLPGSALHGASSDRPLRGTDSRADFRFSWRIAAQLQALVRPRPFADAS
jgi:hypothetical protein